MSDTPRRPNWLLLLAILAVGVGLGLALRGPASTPDTSDTADTTEAPPPIAGETAPPPRPNVGPSALWQGSGAVLRADVNGDGVADAVGRVRYATQRVHVAAFDGRDGSPLWQSTPLGDLPTTARGRLARLGDTVYFGAGDGAVTAFALSDGELRWTAQTGAQVLLFCEATEGWIVARHPDGNLQILSVEDGTLLDGQPDRCNLVVDDDSIIVTPGLQWQSWTARTMARPELPGVKPHAMLVNSELKTAVAVGQTERGAPVLASASGAWIHPLSEGPDAFASGPPKLVTLAGDHAIAVYDLAAGRRVAAFDLESGERSWDVELISAAPPRAVLATDSLILISAPGNLRALHLADGSEAWSTGK